MAHGINLPNIPKYDAKRTGTDFQGYSVFDFRGGLNTREPATLLQDNESPNLLNVNFDVAGSIVKRTGFTKQVSGGVTTSNPVESIFTDETQSYFIMCTNGIIYKKDTNTFLQSGTYTTNSYPDIVYYSNYVYLADGNQIKRCYQPNLTNHVTGIQTFSVSAGASGTNTITISPLNTSSVFLGQYVTGTNVGVGAVVSNINITTGVITLKNSIDANATPVNNTGTVTSATFSDWGFFNNTFTYTITSFTGANNSTILTSSSDFTGLLKVGMSITDIISNPITKIPAGTTISAVDIGKNADGTVYTRITLSALLTGNILSTDILTISSTSTSTMKGKYLVVLKNRLFISGDSTNPDAVYFSELADFTSWNPLNYVLVVSDRDQHISGMASFYDQLYVFKNQGIWGMFVDGSPPSWILRNVNNIFGTVSHKSLNIVGNELFFLGSKGVYGLRHTRVLEYFDVELKSFKIEPDILNIVSSNPTLIHSTIYKNQYILSSPSFGTTYVYNLILNSWTKWSFAHTCYYRINESLFSGKNNGTTSYVYKQDTGYNDDGVAITASYYTKVFDFHMPERVKKMKKILYFVERFGVDSSVTAAMYYDFSYSAIFSQYNSISGNGAAVYGSSSTLYGTAKYGTGSTTESIFRNTLSGQARYVQVTFSNNGLNQPFTVRGFTVLEKPKSMR